MFVKNSILRFLYVLPILFALLISQWIMQKPAITFASHTGTGHNYFVHSSVYNEKVCVDSAGSSIPQSTARTRVNNTLRYDNPSSDWHALANNRIYFDVNTIYCGNMTLSQLADMKMRVYVKDDPTSDCYNVPNVSCVRAFSPVITHNGYTDYAYYKVFLRTSHINGTAFWYHHTIGHEFGHTLGLADPVNCDWDSIMHSSFYGCPTSFEWPTSSDRTSVTNIANSYTIPGG